MKNIITIILFQFMLVGFSNAQTNIEVSNHSVNNNETFTTNINVKPNGASVGAATFSVLYDDNLIEIQDIQEGNSLSGFSNNIAAGTVFYTGINAEGLENSFIALSITFKVISAASLFSNLEIVVEQLTDENGRMLTNSKTDGLLNLNDANCIDYLFVGNANSSSIIEQGVYQASECIESNGIIASEIAFKAGQKIDLLQGFEVQSNASFSIKMEGCGAQ